jgi:hypothetical protein
MKLKKSDQQQLRTEVPRHCWLSDQAVRMAKELRLAPRSLIKNKGCCGTRAVSVRIAQRAVDLWSGC